MLNLSLEQLEEQIRVLVAIESVYCSEFPIEGAIAEKARCHMAKVFIHGNKNSLLEEERNSRRPNRVEAGDRVTTSGAIPRRQCAR